MTAPLLAVEKLSVFYDAFQAVHDVDLTVAEGEIVSIIGANGAGKSSFLKALVRQAGRVTAPRASPATTSPRSRRATSSPRASRSCRRAASSFRR